MFFGFGVLAVVNDVVLVGKKKMVHQTTPDVKTSARFGHVLRLFRQKPDNNFVPSRTVCAVCFSKSHTLLFAAIRKHAHNSFTIAWWGSERRLTDRRTPGKIRIRILSMTRNSARSERGNSEDVARESSAQSVLQTDSWFWSASSYSSFMGLWKSLLRRD